MNGKTYIETSQAEARRCQWSIVAGASRRFKQLGLCHPIRHRNKTALRHCHAIQPEQQRHVASFVALHERETRVDFIGCTQQSQDRVDRTLPAGANSSGDASQQGKLVRPDMVCTRQHHRIGNFSTSMAPWFLCPLEATNCTKAEAKPTGTGNEGGALRTIAEAVTSKRHNFLSVMQLSVRRINSTSYISVHRIRSHPRISVHRIYAGCFQWFPLSVHRTPSSNTTLHGELAQGERS